MKSVGIKYFRHVKNWTAKCVCFIWSIQWKRIPTMEEVTQYTCHGHGLGNGLEGRYSQEDFYYCDGYVPPWIACSLIIWQKKNTRISSIYMFLFVVENTRLSCTCSVCKHFCVLEDGAWAWSWWYKTEWIVTGDESKSKRIPKDQLYKYKIQDEKVVYIIKTRMNGACLDNVSSVRSNKGIKDERCHVWCCEKFSSQISS